MPKPRGHLFESGTLFASLFGLLLLQRAAEYYAPVRALEQSGYGALQFALSWWPSEPPDKLIIVDIGDLPPQDGITPREPLRKLLRTLRDAGARAVGIDIDFSPEENNVFVHRDDPAFFEFCRTLGIPVFLGVSRTAGRGRDAWLGRPDYSNLAAAILIPHDAGTIPEQGTPGPYPLYIPRVDAQSSRETSASDDLRTLAFRLAFDSDRRGKRQFGDDDLTWSWISDVVAARSIGEGHAVSELPVDYRYVRRFERESIAANLDGTLPTVNWSVVNDSLVLLGDTAGSSRSDMFEWPGTGRKISGAVVHASATMTLLRPLRVFKPWMRTIIDVALIAGALTLLRRWSKRKTRRPHARAGRRKVISRRQIAIASSVFGIALAAVIAVVMFHILWFDWMAVTLWAWLRVVFDKGTEDVSEVAV